MTKDRSIHGCSQLPYFWDALKFRCQNWEGTETMVWHPALAVTKCQVATPEGKPQLEGRMTSPSHRQSHESMRHTLNKRLLCLVTHIPSTCRSCWGSDPFWILGTSGLQGQRSKPLGFVSEWAWQSLKCCAMSFVGWAVSHHASVSYDHPNARSTVPTTPLVQDTKRTRKRKLNHNHILGIYSISM